jgi:hypothetical protein
VGGTVFREQVAVWRSEIVDMSFAGDLSESDVLRLQRAEGRDQDSGFSRFSRWGSVGVGDWIAIYEVKREEKLRSELLSGPAGERILRFERHLPLSGRGDSPDCCATR